MTAIDDDGKVEDFDPEVKRMQKHQMSKSILWNEIIYLSTNIEAVMKS